MPRLRFYSSALVLIGLALTPSLGAAQGATQTHTVKKGDTLWDLAQQYLGDAFRWPEIYRRNTTTVQDPNLIYPDQVLIISGDVAATPGTPPDAPAVVAPAAAPVADTPDSAAPMVEAVPSAGFAYTPKPMTIFNPDRFKVVQGTRESLVLMNRASAVREGDYARAPFLGDPAAAAGVGSVGGPIGTDGIAKTRFPRPIQVYERVYVNVPADASGMVDERLISVRLDETIEGEGRVVVPTGVFKLITPAANGRAEAQMLTKYEEVLEGHSLIRSDALLMPPNVTPARVEFGLRTTLLWLYDAPLLPSIGQHVILAAGASDGIVPGDQVTLYRDAGVDSQGVPLPPEDVAVLQVTRVTAWGTSAILISQTDGVIRPGMAGRVTAKMP